jgi:DNA-binding XRE family transcriptional regulator
MLHRLEIIARRREFKLLQWQMADLLGITQDHLSRVETGKLKASEKLERRYEEIFGCKRLYEVKFSRLVYCPNCDGYEIERLNESTEPAWSIYHCKNCDYIFCAAEAWNIQCKRT